MRKSSGHSLLELGFAVLLLVFMALLSTNVYILFVGKSYNERVCRESSALAARAALEGKPTESVQRAAKSGMDSCGYGGVFIGHPQFTAFQDDITTDVRVLKLQTQTLVAVPTPFLLVGMKPDSKNKVVYTSTYTYQIKNPKKAQSDDSDD
ncbi:MAG: hypothetical protein SGJ27_23195 [Candidatus Melainabacteria bacterium]|nr:hypothetical protein [Candidatus Melainabacteria bacterium]